MSDFIGSLEEHVLDEFESQGIRRSPLRERRIWRPGVPGGISRAEAEAADAEWRAVWDAASDEDKTRIRREAGFPE